LGSDKNILSKFNPPGKTDEIHSGLVILFPYMDVKFPDIKVLELEPCLFDVPDT